MPNPLTDRELALITSLRAKPLFYTDRYVFIKYDTKKPIKLWEIRERRGKYLQFVHNNHDEIAARRAWYKLTDQTEVAIASTQTRDGFKLRDLAVPTNNVIPTLWAETDEYLSSQK